MKQLLKLLVFGCYIFITSYCVHAQESTTVFLGGGANLLNSDASQYRFGNQDFGLNGGLFQPLWKKNKFNLGLNLSGAYNFANSDFRNLGEVIPIQPVDGLTTETFSNKVNQSLMQFGLGPQFNFKIGQKFWLSPILQAGFFKFNQDEIVVSQNFITGNNNFSKEVFRQNPVSEGGLFIKPALRMSYQLTDNWSIWGEGNYFLGKVNALQNVLNPLGQPNANGQYDWQQVAEGQSFNTQEKICDKAIPSVNVGLAYSFGGKRDKKPREEEQSFYEDEKLDCNEKIKLVTPKSYKNFTLENKDFPESFIWQKSKFDKVSYTFYLLKGDSLIFEQKTKNNYIESKIFKDRLTLSKENVAQEYSWHVKATNPDCGDFTTNSNSFGIRSDDQSSVTIDSIKCLIPAYVDGLVHYNMVFSIKNGSTSGLEWLINNIEIKAWPSGTLITHTIATPITLNNTNPEEIFSINVGVPIGTQMISVWANGFSIFNGTQMNPVARDSQEEVDNCICNFCDDVRIDVRRNGNPSFVNLPASSPHDALLVNHTLNISPSSSNVVAIDAEIIAYELVRLSSEQCLVCNNQKSQHGTFVNHVVGGVNQSNLITGNFYTSQAMYNTPNGPSGRSIRWQSANPSGVNINNINTRLAVGIPKLINSCCSYCIKIAFRYTFTIQDPVTGECKTCSNVINYWDTCRNRVTVPGPINPKPEVLIPLKK